MSTETDFDFKAAGYECPADWARLYDLIPERTSKWVKKWERAWERAGSRKDELVAMLRDHFKINVPAYDPLTARTRNEKEKP